jgi:pimeloyl-ACP methyl ester carboxylesterase
MSEAWYIYRNSCFVADERPHELKPSTGLQSDILFLHGRYGSCDVWDGVLSAYETPLESSCLEFPGFGRSFTLDGRALSVPDLVELTVQYVQSRKRKQDGKGREVILVGHDLGGAIAQMAALKLERSDPSLVAGMVLLNSCSLEDFPCPKFNLDLILELWRWPGQRRVGQTKLRQLLNTSRSMLPAIFKEAQNKVVAPMRSTVQAVSQTWPDPAEQSQLHQAMKRFDKPVLLLWGGRDELNPPHHAHELMLTYPDVELFQHDQSGHWPLVEHPEWVANKLKEFFFKLRHRNSGHSGNPAAMRAAMR